MRATKIEYSPYMYTVHLENGRKMCLPVSAGESKEEHTARLMDTLEKHGIHIEARRPRLQVATFVA